MRDTALTILAAAAGWLAGIATINAALRSALTRPTRQAVNQELRAWQHRG